jgi:chromosomal replication initiation ATPase DnaA
MTQSQRTALRSRQFTYYEMLAFAQFYQQHRNENSPENLLAAFLQWKKVETEAAPQTRRLLVIESVVTSYYGLALIDVRGKRRYLELVRARQVIAHFAVKYASQNKAANALGAKRDNIQYSKTKCSVLMETEALLRKEVADIEKRLFEPLAAIERELKELEDKTINTQNEDEKITDSEQRAD